MIGSKRTRYLRRSPHLISYWRRNQLVVVNFATGVQTAASGRVIEILEFFEEWRPTDDFLATLPPGARDVGKRVVRALVERTFLHAHGVANRAEQQMAAWGDWNPAAGFFHYATRDVRYVPADTRERAVRRNERVPKPAAPIKRLPGAATVPLPGLRTTHPFSDVLLARRTWRDFATGPVSLNDLGTLLHLTAGVQRWARTGERRAALKTSPSGGATHPCELYVLALDVAGVARGLYHYRADTNALELVRQGARRADVERYMPTQWWYRRAGVVVFFSAIFARSLWRYGYARAYRALLIEAGHLCQTFCLTATWLGLAPFCVMALADSEIEKDLGLDGRSESVLYAAGVGRRPRGVDWAPAPHDEAWPGGPRRPRARRTGRSRTGRDGGDPVPD